jgi:hypothetical protein
MLREGEAGNQNEACRGGHPVPVSTIAMNRPTTAKKTLSPAERKARVDALVAARKVTHEQAALIRYDEEVPEAVVADAAKLVPVAKRALTRARRQAA